MRFEQLRYFVTAVELGSISEAAKFLEISHQSISKAIQLLEEELNTRLLYRSKSGIGLTEKGEIIYSQCKEILEIQKQMLESFVEKTDKPKVLNILVENTFIPYVEYYVKTYCDKDAEYNFDYKEPEYINKNILNDADEEYDGFLTTISTNRFMHIREELEKRYDVYICLQEHIHVIGRKKYLKKKEVSRDDLQDLKFVLYRDSMKYGNFYMNVLRSENKIAFHNVHMVNSVSKMHDKMSNNYFTLGTETGLKNSSVAGKYDLMTIEPKIYVSHVLLIKRK